MFVLNKIRKMTDAELVNVALCLAIDNPTQFDNYTKIGNSLTIANTNNRPARVYYTKSLRSMSVGESAVYDKAHYKTFARTAVYLKANFGYHFKQKKVNDNTFKITCLKVGNG